MDKSRFYICKHCGNLLGLIHDSGVPMKCCGEKMEELIPNTSDGANEKHVPDVKVEGNTVKVQVGSVLHPMLEEHHIVWVYLQTKSGGQRKNLEVGKDPVVSFAITDDEEAVAVYEYCNIHGLWMAEL